MKQLKPKFNLTKVTEKGARCTLHNVRLAFVSLSTPAIFDGKTDQASYQVTALIPEKAFTAIEKQVFKAIEQLVKANKSLKDKEKAKAIENAQNTGEAGAIFKLGDDQVNSEGVPYDGLAGHYTMRAKTKADENEDGTFTAKVPLTIVDSRNKPIPKDQLDELIYSGVWCDLAFSLSAYPQTGTVQPGVTVYLNGVMRLQDDERLGASNPFEARDDIGLDDEDEEELDEEDFDEEELDEEEEEEPTPPKKPAKKKRKF